MTDTPASQSFADGRLTLSAGPVARLTLNAPATRNAMTRAMWLALPAIARQVAADDGIRVLVVTGANDAFCAGADISEFATVYADQATTAAYNAAVRDGQQALRDLAKPVIAMIEGACVGGGCGIALSCDLRFAAPGAVFAITPARLGIAYSPGDTWALVEKVGPARAKDILFSARKLDAPEALSIGLIDRILPQGTLDAATTDYAKGLADLSPASLQMTKTIINALAAGPGTAPDWSAIDRDFAAIFAGSDFAEGRAAFLDRRKPAFGKPAP